MKKKTFLTAAAFAAAFPVMAAVTPAAVFSDNGILQRGCPVPVWGTADANENVTVEFAGQKVSGVADANGYWRVYLSPMDASAENRTMTISGEDNTVTVNNILVGDVWLCSGQSNMEMAMWTDNPAWRATDGDKHVAEGVNPLIRIATVPHIWDNVPSTENTVPWAPLDLANGYGFSATAFYFGQELYRSLEVPVGLLNSCWSGTRIEPWIPPVGFASMPSLADISFSVHSKIPGTKEFKAATNKANSLYAHWLIDFQSAVDAGTLPPPPPAYPAELAPFPDLQHPTVIYNRQIYHLLPFAFKGVIWYQGCSNLGDGAIYQDKMQALLNGWRKVFENPDMPFYFVQLAPFNYGNNDLLPIIWEAQEKFAEANGDEVAMAVINDVGDINDIHPHDKLTVGKRLAALALKYTYGMDIKADSPILKEYRTEGSAFVLSFDHVEEWVVNGTSDDFQIAGPNGLFYPAQVEIRGRELVVSAPEVKVPVSLRYLWSGIGDGNYFNEAGFPLGAFRCGREVTLEEVEKDISDDMQLIYEYDLKGVRALNIDNSAAFSGTFGKVAYVVEFTRPTGAKEWAVISLDAFTDDIGKIGVPKAACGVLFRQKVTNVSFTTNVSGCPSRFLPEGSIEFWSNNYDITPTGYVPGGQYKFDFDDKTVETVAGYGCMQIHDFAGNTTLFAYNNLDAGPTADMGIGNAPGEHPDWTFSNSGANYSKALLRVYVK